MNRLLEIVRYYAFWVMDYLKGQPVRSELKGLIKMNSSEIPEGEAYNELLGDLLLHATETTDFYSKYDPRCLNTFPVINKTTIKESYDGFLSNQFNKESLYRMTTSGSTGTPFTCLQDYHKKKSTYAEVLYYNGQIGYTIGKRIIYLRSVVDECSKSSLKQFIHNIYLLDCYDLSDNGILSIIKRIEKLSHTCGAMVMGYASTFDAFRDFFRRNGICATNKCNIYGIISGSEMLFDDTRRVLEEAFKCRCISRYANEENGFLAQDKFENNCFILNKAHFLFEVLKLDKDEPVENNEIGRIIVTDYKNYAMPMIRYDTGDIGTIVKKQFLDNSYDVIVNFGGRRIDLITNSKGTKISPHSITNFMWKYTEINQYQFIEKTNTQFLVKINKNGIFDKEDDLKKGLKAILGEDVFLEIEYVNEIPVLASGKRKYIVNETNN